MVKNKERLKGISILFQLAGISVLIVNAKLVGETVYYSLNHAVGCYELLIFLAAGVSALETINNWASIMQYIKYYKNVGLFAVDILTLVLLFEQAYVLTKVVEENSAVCIITRVKFLLATYVVLYVLYTLWNCMMGRNTCVPAEKRKEILAVTRWRVAQIVVGSLIAGLLTILEHEWIKEKNIWEPLWVGMTGAYLVWTLLILFFSEKLVEILRTAMEAEHTI